MGRERSERGERSEHGVGWMLDADGARVNLYRKLRRMDFERGAVGMRVWLHCNVRKNGQGVLKGKMIIELHGTEEN